MGVGTAVIGGLAVGAVTGAVVGSAMSGSDYGQQGYYSYTNQEYGEVIHVRQESSGNDWVTWLILGVVICLCCGCVGQANQKSRRERL